MRLRVEGWRHLPHSYSLVHQFQLLSMLRLGVELEHVDRPFFKRFRGRTSGLLAAQDEARIDAIPPPGSSPPDAVYRIDFPYDFKAAEAPTFVFATAEFRRLLPPMLVGRRAPAEALRLGAEIVTPSHWCRRGLIESGATPDRVHVVPHGVDPGYFRPADPAERAEIREELGLGDHFVFLNLGALTPNKGLVPLLKAFARVATRHERALLFFKGIDELYASRRLLDGVAANLTAQERRAISGRVRYEGGTWSLARVARLYQAVDAYVSPYLAEGFNLPVLEAAACGLPVLCTAGGPTDDFVTDDFALRVASSERFQGTPELPEALLVVHLDDLFGSMLRVLEDVAWRRRAARTATAHVHAHYSWDRVTARLLEIIRSRI
jgi:glycosyltransferase involved in cell wall biosynthesis